MAIPIHVNTQLFEGLTATELATIQQRMRLCHFNAGEFLCRAGESGRSLFVLESGAVQVMLGPPSRNARFTSRSLGRLRRGDVVGEMSLLTGEPRSATVIASLPTTALELTQEVFATLLLQYPTIVTNLSRILSHRLAHNHEWQQMQRQKRETIALVVDQCGNAFIPAIVTATRSASCHSVSMLDLTEAPHLKEPEKLTRDTGGVLALLDDLLLEYTLVIVVVSSSQENLVHLLQQVDRVVAIMDEGEAASMVSISGELPQNVELVLITEKHASIVQKREGLHVILTCNPCHPDQAIAWLGRHLSRTKIGLALGAGGARGYAHIAVLQRLAEEGYTVDYIGGSSIGALIGCWFALSNDVVGIETTMRSVFTPETVEELFRLTLSGMSAGYERMKCLCQETTGEASFADLLTPFLVMTADLNTRQPAPITTGPLWEALIAAMSLPGMFPPYVRGEQRLVDGLTLIPVPAGAVAAMGADITISVNLLNREVLSTDSIAQLPPRRSTRMLETLLEVMDLMQMDASIRSAAQAEVVITPRFGLQTWRDFHVEDVLLAVGRRAADEQLTTLKALARPQAVGRG